MGHTPPFGWCCCPMTPYLLSTIKIDPPKSLRVGPMLTKKMSRLFGVWILCPWALSRRRPFWALAVVSSVGVYVGVSWPLYVNFSCVPVWNVDVFFRERTVPRLTASSNDGLRVTGSTVRFRQVLKVRLRCVSSQRRTRETLIFRVCT